MTGTVLIVDDEAILRIVLAEFFLDCGFEVVEAEDADEALRSLEERPEISILLTDVKMPGSIDGFELARRAAALRPHLRIVITSAYCVPAADELPPDAIFLPKPYDVAGVARQLAIRGA